jgi:hypothetical protein
MGSPKRKNHETKDLNPSLVARNKLCKEMGKKPRRILNLEKTSPFATTTQCKVMVV